MKRVFIAVSALLITGLIVVLIAPSFINWGQYKPQIIQQAKKSTGLDVQINGKLALSLLPYPNFMINQVKITNPQDKAQTEILSFERLNVHVELLPLLQGKVSFSSISLEKPVLFINIDKDGQPNFMTAEIKALMGSGQENQNRNNTTPDITLSHLGISNGSIKIIQGKNSTEIDNINLSLAADSLNGPYHAEGSIFYQGHAFDIAMDGKNADFEAKALPLNASLTVKPEDLDVTIAGSLGWGDNVSFQGQIDAKGSDISKIPGLSTIAQKKNYTLSGFLSADQNKLELKELSASLAENTVQGKLDIDLKSSAVTGTLKTQNDFKLGAFMPSLSGLGNVAFNIGFSGNSSAISLSKSQIMVAGQPYDLSGKYIVAGAQKRAALQISIDAPAIDYNKLSAKLGQGGGASGSSDIAQTLRSLALPLDVTLSLNAKGLTYQNYNMSGISLDTDFKQNSITIGKLNINDLSGAQVSAKGKITDLKNLTGIAMSAALQTKNAPKFLQSMSIDTQALPANIKDATIKAAYDGSINNGSLTLNMAALGGEVIASGHIDDPLGKMALSKTAIQIKHNNMAQALRILGAEGFHDPNFSKPLDFYANLEQKGHVYHLNGIKADLSGASLQGALALDLSDAKPSVTGNLDFGDIRLQSTMKASSQSAGTTRAAPAGGGAIGGHWSTEAIDTAILNSFNADLAIKAKSLTYGAWPFIAPTLKITLDDGTLDIKDLKGGLFDGHVTLNTSVNSYDQPRQPLHAKTRATIENVSLAKLTTALMGNQVIKASGMASGNMDVETSGLNPAALIYDLTGTAALDGSNIVLDGVDLKRFARALSDKTKPGDSILGLWKGVSKGGQSKFDTLDGKFLIKDGIVNIQKLDLDGKEASIQTTGNVNLPNWTLATKHKITMKAVADVPPDIPPFEISFSGSLDNPAQTFGQGLLNDYLNRKIQRKLNKILSDKLGGGLRNATPEPSQAPEAGGAQDNTAQPEQQQNENPKDPAQEAIKGIIKGLLR